METGGNRTTNLLTHDSLYGDLTQTGYDVILANMPFGLKGIIHAECCERVKALKIRGTKSEPLFLQLMMVSLNRGGRCAVVVPDGMLVNSSGCHDGTRKYLMDHFELKRVIKMRGQFFMNTGIQPSILFFENTGNPTTTVEFWDVVKRADGSIEETMILSVSRERFDASCSLDMRRYHLLLAGASWMAEYGNPDEPADWAYISRYSPYQNLSTEAEYPVAFFTTSTRDDRVHPGHARKMVAKMLDQGHEVLYYENIEGGHGGAANLQQSAYINALMYSYLHEQLGPAPGEE
jgi:hypothetical protein